MEYSLPKRPRILDAFRKKILSNYHLK